MSKKTFAFALIVFCALFVLTLTQATPSRAEQINQPSNTQLNNAPPAAPPDEDPHTAWLRYLRLTMQDSNGNIPRDGLIKANQQVQRMLATQRRSPSPRAAGISPNEWKALGPGNVGGRVRAIAFNPTTPSTIYLGGVTGGVWRSTDSGVSWKPLGDFMANLNVSSIVVDPGAPANIYVGTGETSSSVVDPRGAGIFKSTNGGNTWSQLANTNNADFQYVNRLAISPSGGILLAATKSGVWRSADGGANWNKAQAIADPGASEVVFNPSDSSKAVASGHAGAGTYYSTDGGVNWTAATGMATSGGRVIMSYAANSTSVVYALISNGQLYRSVNGGQSYSQVNSGITVVMPEFNNYTDNYSSQSGFDMALWVDPTNSNNLLVGGVNLYKSTNGGSSFGLVIAYYFNRLRFTYSPAHPDYHVLVSPPSFTGSSGDIKQVYFGSDGGIVRLKDFYGAEVNKYFPPSSARVVDYLNNGLEITQFYGGAGHPGTGVVIGGTQDNGLLRYTPTNGANGWNNWCQVKDGGYVAVDTSDPSGNTLYGEFQGLELQRSANGGADSTCADVSAGISDSTSEFIAPFILDPNTPTTLLAGKTSLWRSTNIKTGNPPSWTSIKPSLSTISAIAVAPGNSNIIWVGYSTGRVDMTTNGTTATPTWTQVGTSSLPSRFVTRIVVDPTNNNKVYITFGGFSNDNIWRTTDGGASFSSISAATTNLPAVPVRGFAINPDNTAWLYAGSDVGVFASEDSGATWKVSPTNDGPANVLVAELFWMGKTLVAATHGRGMFSVTPGATSLTITGLNPTSKPKGGSDFTLTVNGTGFVSGAQVLWNNSPRTTSFTSSTQVQALINSTDFADPVETRVSVKNPDGSTPSTTPVFYVTSGANVLASDNESGANPTASAGTTSSPSRIGLTVAAITASSSGVGELSVAEFSGDPEDLAAPAATGMYYEVLATPADLGNPFEAMTLTFCGLNGGTNVKWFLPGTVPESPAKRAARLRDGRSPRTNLPDLWLDTSPQAFNSATGCVTLNLDNSTTSPLISDLMDGVEFAATRATTLFLPFVGR